MKIVSRIILVIALAALGVWLWTVLFPSPEKIIRKQLAGLANEVSFSQDQNSLIKLAHAQSVADFFTSNVEVDVNVPGHGQQTMLGRDQITQAVLASRQEATDLKLKFPDVNITVAPDNNSAVADVTVDATISGERDAILQEVKITFQKVDGKWLINKVESVNVVS